MGIYNGVVTRAKTLFDLMYEADAVNIDDQFVRYFHMEHDFEEDEEDDPIICHIEFEQDYNNYEYFFTKKDLLEAEYDKNRNAWSLKNNRDCDWITPYRINEIK
jgi:hypothetical protein